MPILEVAAQLATALAKLLSAGDDKARQEEALMDAADVAKRELDRRAFGG